MPQPAPGGPTVLRMIIARQLQVLRENAGLSYEQAANAIYTSAWTVRRMERADGGLKLHSVKGLLQAYRVADDNEIREPWSGTNGGACLEARKLPDGRVALRQSTDPDSPPRS